MTENSPNPLKPIVRLSAKNKNLDKNLKVRIWLDNVEDIMNNFFLREDVQKIVREDVQKIVNEHMNMAVISARPQEVLDKLIKLIEKDRK